MMGLSKKIRSAALAALPVLAMIAIACSSGSDEQVASALAQQQPGSDTPSGFRVDELPLIRGPISEDGLQAIFATPDLGIGEHRVGFVLQSKTGLVRTPAVSVSFYFVDDSGNRELKKTALATFKVWPYATRGIYITQMDFDTAGRWELEINVLEQGGDGGTAQLAFDVDQDTSAPAAGTVAINSASKTLSDVEDISQLTTGSLQDPDLYRLSISDALNSGLPTVIVMASPAFCTTAVCGPQVEVLQELKDAYKGQANFIHVDFYDNPDEIQGDLDRAILSPTVLEWSLPSTEWSFVIDRDGTVAGRFESFTTYEELEQSLQDVL